MWQLHCQVNTAQEHLSPPLHGSPHTSGLVPSSLSALIPSTFMNDFSFNSYSFMTNFILHILQKYFCSFKSIINEQIQDKDK